MEPRIQHAKTEDGVSIAFWTMGHGVPLVWPHMVARCNGLHHLAPPVSAMHIAWQQRHPFAFSDLLGAEERVVTDTLEVGIAGDTLRKSQLRAMAPCAARG